MNNPLQFFKQLIRRLPSNASASLPALIGDPNLQEDLIWFLHGQAKRTLAGLPQSSQPSYRLSRLLTEASLRILRHTQVKVLRQLDELASQLNEFELDEIVIVQRLQTGDESTFFRMEDPEENEEVVVPDKLTRKSGKSIGF